MSQSDYINLKKTKTLLYNLKTSKILSSQKYTLFKQYAVETSVTNTLPQLNQLIPPTNKIIFDMNVNVTCPVINQKVAITKCL